MTTKLMNLSARGMTIMEVMVALSIFAIAILGVFSTQWTVAQQQKMAVSRVARAITYNNIVNMIQGSAWTQLAGANQVYAGWSIYRAPSGANALTLAALAQYGIISQDTALLSASGEDFYNPNISLVYYRMTANLDANNNKKISEPGLLDIVYDDPKDFLDEIHSNGSSYILTTGNSGLNDELILTSGNPVMAVLRVAVSGQAPRESFLGIYTP